MSSVCFKINVGAEEKSVRFEAKTNLTVAMHLQIGGIDTFNGGVVLDWDTSDSKDF